MYLRCALSDRDVQELLAERGIQVAYKTVRRRVLTFGPLIARRLRAHRPAPHGRWHLDEMFVRIGGEQMHLWRAVDAKGEILDVLDMPNGTSMRPASSCASHSRSRVSLRASG